MRLLLPMALLFAGCVTQLFDEPPPTPEHYFKQAQVRLGLRDFDGAMAIHRLLMVDYPEDFVLWARATFNNAQIYLEQGKKEKAAQLYRAVVDARQQPEGASIPPAIILLAQKHLAELEGDGA